MRCRLFTLMIGTLLAATAGIAQTPRTISYQGVLTDGSGNPVADGSYALTFRLYDVASGGAALWTEAQNVATQKGLFSAILGGSTSIVARFDKPYWLGITVGAGSEMVPRSPLSGTPYSFRAIRADSAATLSGFSASASPAPNTLLALDATGKFPAAAIPASVSTTRVLTVGSAAFTPQASSYSSFNGSGQGGAWCSSGVASMSAPIYLPDSAIVTKLEVFFVNNSTTCTVDASLMSQFLTGTGYQFLATVSSTGISGSGSKSTTTITSPIVNNSDRAYLLHLYSTNWDGFNLRVAGAKVTYTSK